jgi:SnoaL-like domain
MRVMKKVLAGVVAVSFVALLAYRAAARGNDTQREAQDCGQIEKLMWQYVRALDTENPAAYAATYTPDGQFGTGAKAIKGHEALKKMIADLRPTRR